MKPIKFDLSLNGTKIRNLEELCDNFTTEILELYASGLLLKWLKNRNLMAEAEKLSAISVDLDDDDKLVALCEIFGVEVDQQVIEAALSKGQPSQGVALRVDPEELTEIGEESSITTTEIAVVSDMKDIKQFFLNYPFNCLTIDKIENTELYKFTTNEYNDSVITDIETYFENVSETKKKLFQIYLSVSELRKVFDETVVPFLNEKRLAVLTA